MQLEAVLPKGEMSYLSSVAPEGFYEAAWQDEQGREGWVSGPEHNGCLGWDFAEGVRNGPTGPMNGAAEQSNGEWGYSYLYPSDIPPLSPQLTEGVLAKLKSGLLEAGETRLALDPSSPGALQFAEDHTLNCAFGDFARQSKTSRIAGLYFHRPDEKRECRSSDPVVLLAPGFFEKGEMVVMMTLNLDRVLPCLPGVLKAAALGQDCTKIRAWGVGEDDALMGALRPHGAVWKRRVSGWDLPFGVAWYGAGSAVMDLEAWAWA